MVTIDILAKWTTWKLTSSVMILTSMMTPSIIHGVIIPESSLFSWLFMMMAQQQRNKKVVTFWGSKLLLLWRRTMGGRVGGWGGGCCVYTKTLTHINELSMQLQRKNCLLYPKLYHHYINTNDRLRSHCAIDDILGKQLDYEINRQIAHFKNINQWILTTLNTSSLMKLCL